jgi:predicted chitinase
MKLQDIYGDNITVDLEELKLDRPLAFQVQTRLNTLGLSVKVDGLWGPLSLAAYKRFTKGFNYPGDRLTPEVAEDLIEAKTLPGFDRLREAVLPEVAAAIMNCKLEDAVKNLKSITEALAKRKILNRLCLVATLATIKVETGGFSPIPEYGGDRYFTQNYEDREDLGNNQPGDGARYKGRGFVQITGRANYQYYGKKLGVPLLENPDLALQADVASEILAEYFFDRRISEAANKHDWEQVRRLVNGGLNGWHEFWEAVKKFDGVMAK